VGSLAAASAWSRSSDPPGRSVRQKIEKGLRRARVHRIPAGVGRGGEPFAWVGGQGKAAVRAGHRRRAQGTAADPRGAARKAWRAGGMAWRAGGEAWRAGGKAWRAAGEAWRVGREAWRAGREAWRAAGRPGASPARRFRRTGVRGRERFRRLERPLGGLSQRDDRRVGRPRAELAGWHRLRRSLQGHACDSRFAGGTNVQLCVTPPNSGTVFNAAWSGSCSGTGSCTGVDP